MNHKHGPQTTDSHDLNDSHDTLHVPHPTFDKAADEITLDTLAVGVTARVTGVYAEGALRRRLLDMGITPHTHIKIHKQAPMGDPLELRLRGYSLSLRKADAKKIGVTVLPGGEQV